MGFPFPYSFLLALFVGLDYDGTRLEAVGLHSRYHAFVG